MRTVPLLLAAGCVGTLGIPDTVEGPPPPLALVVGAPADLSFAGDAPVVIEGSVSHPDDEVWIEGRLANVGSDGGFHVELPAGPHLSVFTIEAVRGDERIVEHRTVFAGADPMASWPGALPLRVTPGGLELLARVIAEQVDALDLAGQLSALIPAFSISGFGFAPTGGSADPTVAVLTASEGGLVLNLQLPELELAFDATAPIIGAVPVELGLERLGLGATLALGIDPSGAATLGVTDTDLQLEGPILRFAGIESGLLSALTDGLVAGVGEALELALDSGALALGDLVLPGGTIETDALGFPLALELGALDTDAGGVVANLEVDLGVPSPGTPHAPTLPEAAGADFALTLHEGILGGLLSGDLLSALDLGTLELPGFLGEIVALPLAGLPGGSELPADRTGMCLTLGVPQTGVGRVEPGLAPMGRLLLPDLLVEVGVTTATTHCSPWLSAELALSASLTADGTALVVGLDVIDGAVLSYAVESEWSEDEVVGGLGALVDATSSLLGTSLAIDLSTLVDPALLGGTPRITSVRAATDPAGLPVPGAVVVGLSVD